jgi:hypothetical protein
MIPWREQDRPTYHPHLLLALRGTCDGQASHACSILESFDDAAKGRARVSGQATSRLPILGSPELLEPNPNTVEVSDVYDGWNSVPVRL